MARQRSAQPLPHVAVIYDRVSTKHQGGEDRHSLETQEANCRARALADGYPLVPEESVYTDKHTGEELHERPAMTRLRAAAKAHQFAALYVNSVDRLARDPIHLSMVLEEMAKAGVRVIFVTEPLTDTPEAAIIRYIQGYGAKLDNARRRESSMRGRHARVRAGKPLPGPRARFGFRWAEVRDSDGRRLRERLEHDPITGLVVARVWRIAQDLAPWTLRGIAATFTQEGVPTPTGKKREWDGGTIRDILTDPIYWGRPMGLQSVQESVDLNVRSQYVHRTRHTRRAVEEQIALPEEMAPAFVTPEAAALVAARLTQHQEGSGRSKNATHDPLDTLLRGGIARCGYCGYALYVARPGSGYVAYRCRRLAIRAHGCKAHSISTKLLDRKVWEKLKEILQSPTLIETEVAHLRKLRADGELPGAAVLSDLETRLTQMTRRIENKRRYAEFVDDEEEQRHMAEEVTLLLHQRRDLEAERLKTQAHYASWEREQEGLERTLDACARLAQHLDGFTRAEMRETLLTLKARVRVWRRDHQPDRADLTITLPISGVHALGAVSVGVNGHSDVNTLVLR